MSRIDKIERKVNDWFSFKLKENINDIMPDVAYLLEKVKISNPRIDLIKEKVDLWFSFQLNAHVNDIMPDVVYLLEELKKI